jgi:hypothetical protein
VFQELTFQDQVEADRKDPLGSPDFRRTGTQRSQTSRVHLQNIGKHIRFGEEDSGGGRTLNFYG